MAKSMNQKGKILYLEKILRETGENHTCTMQDILGRLMEYGIHAERKSIYDDMEVLRSFGMDIQFKRGKPGGYYLAGHCRYLRVKLLQKKLQLQVRSAPGWFRIQRLRTRKNR